MSEIKLGAVLNYISLFVRLGIGFFLTPFILYHLGRSEYGLYAIAGTIVGWLSLFDFGLSSSTTKFICEYQARNDDKGESHFLGIVLVLFSIIGAIVLIAGLALYPFLHLIFNKFSDQELGIYRILYLMTLFNAALLFPTKSLNGIATSRQKFVIPGIISLATSILTTVCTVIALTLGFKSIALVGSSIFVGIVASACNIYYYFSHLGAKISWSGWDQELCNKLFGFSFWMFLNQLISLFNWGCGNIIIGMTQGASEIAIYSYALALLNYYLMCSNCLGGLFLPRVVKQVTQGASPEILTDIWIRVGRLQLFILLLPLLMLLFFGLPFLDLWLGHTLGKDITVTWIVALILIISVSPSLIQCLGWEILQAKGAVRHRAKAMLVIAILNLVLGYFLSIRYGSIGLAIGTASSFVIGHWIYLNWLYKRRIGLNVRRFISETIHGMLKPFLLCSLSGCALSRVPLLHESWPAFLSACSAFAILYFIFTYKFYLSDDELAYTPPRLRSIMDKINIRKDSRKI